MYPKARNVGATKIAIDSTLDSEAEEIIHVMIQKDVEKLKVAPVAGKIIRPLYLFLDKEVLLYAILKELDFKEKKHIIRSSKSQTKEVLLYENLKLEKIKPDKISRFIDKLEEKHPEVKRAIVNSYLAMC